MPVTPESFRDPRKLYQVRAISGFYHNDKAVEPGTILNLPRSQAADLLHGGKAELVLEPTRQAPPPPAPAPAAAVVEPAATVHGKTSTSKEKAT